MAEFLAVTGGLAAVVQLAASGRRLVKTLYRFAVDAGAAAAEVERFANQVRTFSGTVEVAQQTVSFYCRENPESPVVAFIKSSQVLADIDSEASTVQAHLWAIRDQVIDMKSRWVVWASIKWSVKKSSILELSPQMESVKTSLCLLMASTNLEALISRSGNNRDSNKELAKEIRQLRRVIRHHVQTMQDLRLQLGPARRFADMESFDSLDGDLKPQDALIELGRSMYRRGTVPDPSRISPSSSENHFSVRGAPSNPPDQPRMARQMPRERRGPDTALPTSTPSQPGGSAPTLRRASPRKPPPPSSPSPEATSSSKERPLVSNTLRYREEDVSESIGGYVRSPRGALHQVTASLVETLNGNIISIGTAQALSLEIEALGPDEGVTFDFGTGRSERSIGKVTFEWKVWDHINPRYPPLTVTCDVCENSTIGLVLGRPFIRERERRWSRSGSSEKY